MDGLKCIMKEMDFSVPAKCVKVAGFCVKPAEWVDDTFVWYYKSK